MCGNMAGEVIPDCVLFVGNAEFPMGVLVVRTVLCGANNGDIMIATHVQFTCCLAYLEDDFCDCGIFQSRIRRSRELEFPQIFNYEVWDVRVWDCSFVK